jgi:ribokinase
VTIGVEPGRVIVVGSVNVDLVVTTDRLPVPGETVTGGRFARHHGGKGGNQAVAAARLGARTWFVGAVGEDAFGSEARAALEADGVDTTELATLPWDSTGVALIIVDAAGENSIAVAGGANATLTTEHVSAALERLAPRPGDVVLVCHEIPTGTASDALRRARAAGATTIFNPAPADGVTPDLLSLTDLLTPNLGEAARLLVGEGEPDALAAELVGSLAGGGHVLISLGADGARLHGQDGAVTIPAPLVTAIDTVGAGDTLNGALAAGLAAGLDLEVAALRAVTAASLATTRAGAREGMPTVAELTTALEALTPP